MDFKANIDEIATICNKIENNTDSIQQEITKSKKVLEELPSVWNDDGSTVFIEKYTQVLESLQTLAKAYNSITTETKKSLDKYQTMDHNYSNKSKIAKLDISKLGGYIEGYQTGETVYYSKKYNGEYYVCRFNESTGKNEYYPASADFGKEGVYYDGSGGKLVIRKFNESTGKYEYMDSPTSTIPEEDLKNTLSPVPRTSNEYYIKWFNESTGEYQYISAPEGFNTGEVKFDGGASLVVKKLNEKTGKYEYVDVSTEKGGK